MAANTFNRQGERAAISRGRVTACDAARSAWFAVCSEESEACTNVASATSAACSRYRFRQNPCDGLRRQSIECLDRLDQMRFFRVFDLVVTDSADALDEEHHRRHA